ncbi:hypothetical protein Poly30_38470 [Planctomycetes bacterium Poly30]|uniref:DUF1800 domain-containing protein n=1 Tax=Saltatorellus ferox TaxID=2528018 RepID=A0A518EW47_9BACT|nr:hypothetical protein Poly30_38470 [Planctomycetes bacterium Poly30]
MAPQRLSDSPPDLVPLLLARATFGYTPEEAGRVRSVGHDAWLAEQLQPERIDDSELDAELTRWPWLARDIRFTIGKEKFDPRQLRSEFKGIRLLRAVKSKRQLLERAVEYWSNHFSVYIGALARIFDDSAAWRPHVLGRFEDLLIAVTRSPTMIFYLDNHSNTAGAANENLAREILELHTLGSDGPYTESDVRELARALTGWTFEADKESPDFGGYRFDESRHDAGPKEILGISFPAGGGDQDVLTVLRHLAKKPETADHVVRRMARWFLGVPVPDEIVEDGKGRWFETDGDLREVLRTLLSEAAIACLAAAGQTSFRRPLEWLTAVYRGSGAAFPEPAHAHRLAQRLGQAPYEWYSPDGYPDDRASWVGLMEPRWAAASEIVRGSAQAGQAALATLGQVVASCPRESWAARLDAHWTGGRLRPQEVHEIQAYLDALPTETPPEAALADACELILTCPSFHEI